MTLRTLFASALLTLTLGACDEATPDLSPEAALRTALGKADHVEGSCAAVDDDGPACGGPAPVGNCWCDDACLEYGDCCSDAFDACGIGEPPEPAVSQCLSDAQCDDGQTCAGGVCIELTPDCDDGSALHPLCDIKPACDDGQVAAIQNGCFACVDELTCEPPAPPASCGDGSNLSPFCDVPPLCPEGTEKFIVGACFHCLDPQTCEPA